MSTSTPQNNNINDLKSVKSSHLLSELPLHSKNLLFGLNFKHTKVDKKGIVSKLKGEKQSLDIDLSCLLLDKEFKVIDTIWFKNLRDKSETVRHFGDSINGKDRGDMAEFDRSFDVEKIELDLPKLPKSIQYIAFMISSYYDYPIKSIERGNVYISDDEGNEVYASDLTLLNTDASALLIATMSREISDWRFTINSKSLSSVKMADMTQQVTKELLRTYS